jgi:hypothetical protein
MPYGAFANDIPSGVFLVIHIIAFAIGAGCAWAAINRSLSLLGWAFGLFAAAELSYMTYHLDWTVFLLAHTISEVLDLLAFICVFVAAVKPVALRARGTRS